MALRSAKGYVIKRALPAVVWFAALAGTVVLFQYRMQDYKLVGIARDNTRKVSPLENGRIKDVGVRLYQRVNRGQVVARMQDDHIATRLQTIRAEIGKLGAEMDKVRDQMLAEAERLESEKAATHRRFVLDVEAARLKVLELQAQIEPQLIRLGNLQAEVQIEKDLFDAGAVTTDYAVKQAQNEYDVVAESVAENRELLAAAEQAHDKAVARYQQYQEAVADDQNGSLELAIAPIIKEIDVQESLLEELQVQRFALDLRAPADGTVRQILAGEGETVLAGQPIVVVAPEQSTDVVAYVKQNQYVDLRADARVQLIRQAAEPQVADARVYEVSPAYELMPERLWQDPRVPEYGRAVLIEIPQQFEVDPGEVVGVRLL
ncbi:putative efflux pump membrane fusion protein [Anaerohalosphaera lusitana]|uniref:Putative efflux pump membrane fusion protein n=1 Tax=Anaerohalosphaera lusitana TaxID=1936003 RepID=A0A1U9NIX3_9BACT|nr:HlyD family efflux transporter periplasmic adaptor subunit [Anaerohalosphaera lusitana]AQT67882.1 putative efflux pump membrane fusion protein [Anaerohalosphaera lusitana]